MLKLKYLTNSVDKAQITSQQHAVNARIKCQYMCQN